MLLDEFMGVISKEPEYPTINYRNPDQDARTAAWEDYRTRNLRLPSTTNSPQTIQQSPQSKDFWLQRGKQGSTGLFPIQPGQ